MSAETTPPTEDHYSELPHRYDLGAIMRQELPPPRKLGDVLYHGKLHTLSGPPESGKTVTALWFAYRVMSAGGTVFMMDEETGPRQVADLLRSMGASAEMIDKYLIYHQFMGMSWRNEMAREQLLGSIAAGKPVLAIFDSAAEMLAASGLDENDAADVTAFWRLTLRPIAMRHRCAVLLLDHDGRSGAGTRYSRGSGAKLAAPDVSIKIEQLRPFSRNSDGLTRLNVTKDRLGSLHRWWRIRVRVSPLTLEFSESSPTTVGEGELSPAAQGLLDVMTDVPRAQRVLVDLFAAKFGHGLKGETASRALSSLNEMGLCDRLNMGPGRPALWVLRGNALTDATAQPTADTRPKGGGWPEGSEGFNANS